MLQYIPIGRENAIKRSELCRLTGLSDRAMRNNLEHLKTNQRIPIVNMQDGCGYYIARTHQEAIQYAKILESHANALLAEAHAIRHTDWYK